MGIMGIGDIIIIIKGVKIIKGTMGSKAIAIVNIILDMLQEQNLIKLAYYIPPAYNFIKFAHLSQAHFLAFTHL